ncbi:MAG: hypothetical protein ACJ74J_17960 [Blastocatellia bacterium]
MTTQRLSIVITIVNLVILMLTLAHLRPATADGVLPVLRGHALEIVDAQGKVRASIGVFPADPSVKMPDGTTGYPETVLLRLINSKGGPNVKIAATEDGSALSLGGETSPTYAQILARGASTWLKLVNKDGREQVIKPQ